MAVWHCKWSTQTSAAQIETFVSLSLFLCTNLSMSTQDMARGTQKNPQKIHKFSNTHNPKILMINPALVIFYHRPSFPLVVPFVGRQVNSDTVVLRRARQQAALPGVVTALVCYFLAHLFGEPNCEQCDMGGHCLRFTIMMRCCSFGELWRLKQTEF